MEAGPAALFDYLYSLGMTVVNIKTHLIQTTTTTELYCSV